MLRLTLSPPVVFGLYIIGVILLGLVAFLAYTLGYNHGVADAFDEGYSQGAEATFADAYSDGFNDAQGALLFRPFVDDEQHDLLGNVVAFQRRARFAELAQRMRDGGDSDAEG